MVRWHFVIRAVVRNFFYTKISLLDDSHASLRPPGHRVKVCAKLSGWFKVLTTPGTYNPDWAVLVEIDGQEKLYLVVETKGSNWWDNLRHRQSAKIKCGEKHFAELAVG